MKKIIMSAAVLGMTMGLSFAQNDPTTDDFTTSGVNTTTNSNVGIGTTTPQQKLHVKGGDILLEETTDNEDADLVIRNKTGHTVNLWVDSPSDNSYLQTAGGSGNSKLILGAGNWESTMYVLKGGKVGIKTSYVPDGYSLGVKNGIITEKVKVALASQWGDFVFDNDYDLQSLEEVESYIEENNHLSGIPSATEIDASGVELGEMVRLQMIKIEELTLYIVELNKKVVALEKNK